jgi:hypothetical protein
MRLIIVSVVLFIGMATIAAQQLAEDAMSGSDSRSNGVADETTHQADKPVSNPVEDAERRLDP